MTEANELLDPSRPLWEVHLLRNCHDSGAALPELLAESLSELREAAGSSPRRPVRNPPLEPLSHADQTLET